MADPTPVLKPNFRFKNRNSPIEPIELGVLKDTRIWEDGSGIVQPLGEIRPSGTLGYKREAVSYEVHKGPPFKEGGPFKLSRYELTRSTNASKWTGKYDYGWYRIEEDYDMTEYGDFSMLGLPNKLSEADLNYRWQQVLFPSQDLSVYAEEAINRINPVNISKASVAQSLIELMREGMPSVPGLNALKKRLRKGSTGGEYLNVQFGWRPLVQEVINVYEAFKSADKMYKQLVRDNNRKVRRRATLYRNEETSTLATYPVQRVYPISWSALNPSDLKECTATKRVSTRVWTVGAGKYYIPNIDSVEFKKRFIEELYGTKPNLALVYELMPWSWMLDWITNVGDVIQYHLAPQLAEFVLDYSYIMRHVQTDITYNSNGFTYPAYPGFGSPGAKTIKVPAFQARERFETKERIAATPFGFGLKLEDLSSKQLAILAALGISKTRF